MCCLRGPLTKTIDLFTNEIASHLRTKAETGTANSNHDSNEHSSARDSGAGNKSRRRRQSDSGDSDSSGSESEDSLAWYSLELMDDGERLAESYKKTDNIVTSKTTKEDESNEYVTLCSNLQDNIYEVTGLKAGSRYKCRVRCKLNDRPDWNPWDSAVVSDIFSMPATPPDPPFMVRAAVSVAYSHTATTAAATAQEANFAATLLGSQEFIPRDTAHFDPPPSNISNDPAKAATIFDYDLSELEAMAPMIEVPLSEITPSGDDDYGFDGEPSETVLKRAPIPEFDPQNPLCGLEKSIKIRPNKTMSMSNSIMTQKNASSVYLSESERIGKESFGEEIEEGDRDGDGDGDAESRSVADSFSMSVQMQSVTSSVIARQTDVDIKSGLYVPGLHATSSAISTAPGLISAEASYSSTFLPAPVEEVQLDIMHDSITIAWQSGQANGLPVEEFVVECARVRTYRLVDVVRAKEAYQNVVETDEAVQEGAEDNSAVTNPVYGSPARKRLAQPASLLLEDGAEPSDDNDNNTQKDPVDCWEWEDITHTGGYFTEFQKFKATNLTPGCTYIFRVKQRNACGWSVFSGSSRMIATYPSVPPGVPAVFAVRNTYAAVRWAESAHPGIGLTNLEYDVQLGIVPPVLLTDQRDSSQDPRVGAGQDQGVPVSLMGAKRADPHKTAWSTVEVRYFPEEDQLLRAILRETATGTSALPASVMSATRSSDKKTAIIAEAGEGETFVHVMLPRLISHVTYIIRVRVRTVVGWSPWSEISAPFRTQS